MNKAFRLPALAASTISCLLSMANSAFGHAAPLPAFSFHKATTSVFLPHSAHGIIPLSRTSSSLEKLLGHQSVRNFNLSLPGPGSLTARNFHALVQRTVVNGIAAGQSQAIFSSGAITGGQLEGDLYFFSTAPSNYLNVREFIGTIGQNIPANYFTDSGTQLGQASISGIQNTITFASGSTTLVHGGSKSGGIGIPVNSIFPGHSGSQRALASLFSGLTPKSVSLGQQIGLAKLGGQQIAGGLFTGTIYRNNIGSSGYFVNIGGNGSYVFAFGNNQFNKPIFSVVSIPPQQSYLQLTNGRILSISNGQILFPTSFGMLQNGSVFTIGSNPFNNHLLGSGPLPNLNSFLFF